MVAIFVVMLAGLMRPQLQLRKPLPKPEITLNVKRPVELADKLLADFVARGTLFLECGGWTRFPIVAGPLLHESIAPAAEESEEAEVAKDLELLADFVADVGVLGMESC